MNILVENFILGQSVQVTYNMNSKYEEMSILKIKNFEIY